jgi:hypothetical protein
MLVARGHDSPVIGLERWKLEGSREHIAGTALVSTN